MDGDYIQTLNEASDHCLKETINVSDIEVQLFKLNINRFLSRRLKARIYWEHNSGFVSNIFQRNLEFQVYGNEEQIKFIKNQFKMIDKSIQNYKT